MNGPDLREPDSILEFLSREIVAIHHALDQGASAADDFFNMRPGFPTDKQLWAFIVRHDAANWLDSVAESPWERPVLPLAGLQIVRGSLSVRILKSRDGEVPPPGSSLTRQKYYSQMTIDTGVPEDSANLILDWRMSAQRELTCHLSKPMAGQRRYSQTPMLEWRHLLTLPHDGGLPSFQGSDDNDLSVGLVIDSSEFKVASAL